MNPERAKSGVVLALACLVAYGSLYPFQFQATGSPGDLLAEFFSRWRSDGRLTDLLGNIALFFPLGVASAYRWRRFGMVPRIARSLVLWAAFAILLQLAQLWLPGRIAALSDVFWNVVGVALGMGAARLLGNVRFGMGAQPVPMALLAAWLLSQAAPLVPALGWQEFKDSLKPLLLAPHFEPGVFAMQFAMALAVAKLMQVLPGFGRSAAAFALVLLGALVLQLAVTQRVVELNTVLAFLGAWIAWRGLMLRSGSQTTLLVIGLLAAFTLRQLLPFEITGQIRDFHWVPFAASLNGNLLDAVINFSALLFLFGSVLWLLHGNGGRLWPAAVALAVWVFLLELSQTVLSHHTPDITPAVLVLIAAAALNVLVGLNASQQPADAGAKRSPAPRARAVPTRRPAPLVIAGPWHLSAAAVGIVLALAAAVHWAVGLPNVPYNVRELFHGPGFIYKVMFSVAVLWIGVGSALMAYRLTRARWPYMELPVLLLAVCVFSLLLLSLGVTNESIMDIAGSNNLNWYIIHREIWGHGMAELLRRLDSPWLVALFERPVRYTALLGPLVLSLALFGAAWIHRRAGTFSVKRWLLLVAASLPWFWLSKAIAFDWSSTDNLNELIARDGSWGVGGGGYLYALLLLFCANVVLVSMARVKSVGAVVAAATTILAIPVSWWLLKQGLNPQIEKYGVVFSGVQFLLGPDRSHALSAAELFGRWAIVYLAAVIVISAGFRFGAALALLSRDPAWDAGTATREQRGGAMDMETRRVDVSRAAR